MTTSENSESATSNDPADRYLAFRSRVFGIGLVTREDEELAPGFGENVDELELQSRWFAGEFGSVFTTLDGKRVEVCDFGHWNHSAGPDFGDCAVLIDGELRRGPIELDTDLREWERHGHGKNRNYDGVVLHLFVRAPDGVTFFTRTSDHREIPQVRLDLSALEAFSGRKFAEARLGRCATPLEAMGKAEVDSLLEAAAKFRLRAKGERIAATARIHGREQALFQGVAEALGYRQNRRPMLVLAQRFPLKMLLAEKADAEAILFGAAGFLDADVYGRVDEDGREYLRALWETWWKRRSDLEGEPPVWNLAGSRPGNHPQRRLGALAALLGRWKKFTALVADAGCFDPRAVTVYLEKLEHPFWNLHYTLTSDPAKGEIALVGATRAGDILANQIYPLLVRESVGLWGSFKDLRARMENEKVRRAAARLLGENPHRKELTRRVYQHQGLLQIYADFCLADSTGCDECPFPEQLRTWRK